MGGDIAPLYAKCEPGVKECQKGAACVAKESIHQCLEIPYTADLNTCIGTRNVNNQYEKFSCSEEMPCCNPDATCAWDGFCYLVCDVPITPFPTSIPSAMPSSMPSSAPTHPPFASTAVPT